MPVLEHEASRRRTGRPRVDATDTSVKMTVTLPARSYDVLYRTAGAQRQSVSEFVRRTLQRVLEAKLPPRGP